MKLTVIAVGKIKEKYLKDAVTEYSKRLSRYCKLEIMEVADEKTPDQASEAVEEAIRTKEETLGVQGKSSIAFVIGGSIGLGKEVLKRSDFALSFSKMTFPHQLMRVVLLEQVYRGYRIMNGEPYHK